MDGVSYAILGVNLENYNVNSKNYDINKDILSHAENESVFQKELLEQIKKLVDINNEMLIIMKRMNHNA